VVLQLDFNTAFTSTNLNAVYSTLEAYGVPEADISLIRRMQTNSWYSVVNPFGETAACDLEKGMKQGDPTSPGNFLTVMDPILRILSASGRGWKLAGERPSLGPPGRQAQQIGSCASDPSAAFLDDIILVTLGLMAVADACFLLAIIVRLQPWTGVSINVDKSTSAAIDYATNRQVDTSSIQYRNRPLPMHPPDKPFPT
jgi:hypothetical protein